MPKIIEAIFARIEDSDPVWVERRGREYTLAVKNRDHFDAARVKVSSAFFKAFKKEFGAKPKRKGGTGCAINRREGLE